MKGLLRLSSAIALAAMMATTAIPAFTAPARAATLSGGFDVGPGGFQGNFNPLAATGGFTWLSVYFEPLVTYDEKLEKVVGQLASSYEVSPDQTTYTFKLADAKWHDGKPFTAKDAKFTLELAKNAKTGSVLAARLNAVSSAEAKDDKTLIIKLSAPSASLMDTLTKVMMLPEHALSQIPADQLAKNSWWSTAPIGTGPFQLVQYQKDAKILYKAFDRYWEGKPKLDRLVFSITPDVAVRYAKLQKNECQVMPFPNPADLARMRQDGNIQVMEKSGLNIGFLAFNTQKKPLDNVKVRQALALAVNKPAIIDAVFHGAGQPAKNLLPPAQW
ncbi:ABC transporter substrate-binding protein, partial [Rhizobium phaseoli]